MSQPGLPVQEAGDAGKTFTGRGLGQVPGFVEGQEELPVYLHH